MSEKRILSAKGGFLMETYRESGLRGCARKIAAAIRMSLPIFTIGRRTNSSVAAYFDLITDDARMFYGDSFHFGYFKNGTEDLSEALINHTDIVAEMAGIDDTKHVLDIGCGVCAPAIRIAKKYGCKIKCINISGEQVRQGRNSVKKQGLTDLIEVEEENALALSEDDESFDSILCLEVAGDICCKKSQKKKLADEMYRVLKPGGKIGFSDLVFTGEPTREDDRAMRAILYHEGAELITDWPAIFEASGFRIDRQMDIIKDTMKTWEHSLAVYERKADEVNMRYGKAIAERTRSYLRQIPEILERHGSFIVMSAVKPT